MAKIDASDRVLGAILMQDSPIDFENKKLYKVKQNYSIYKRELFEKCHYYYLHGTQFEIVFDPKKVISGSYML